MATWMVRAERDGILYSEFREQGYVGIGWSELGDLNAYASRAKITEAFQRAWPESRHQKVVNAIGCIDRFQNQMKIGDTVLTYDPPRRVYSVGTVTGDYLYAQEKEETPHTRAVGWNSKELSRDALSLATRNSLGSSLTQFQLSLDGETDVARAMSGVPLDEQTNVTEESDDLLDDIASRSAEFIKDRIVRLEWDEMQELVAGILRAMGYKTRVSPPGADRGKDIVASPDGFGFEDPRIVVEVKHRPRSSMGAPEIRGFLGGRHPGDKGLYVSTGGFSKDALYEAERANIPVALMDLNALVAALLDHYESLDAQTRQLVPLTRVYWPLA
jgi:restriction system protein